MVLVIKDNGDFLFYSYRIINNSVIVRVSVTSISNSIKISVFLTTVRDLRTVVLMLRERFNSSYSDMMQLPITYSETPISVASQIAIGPTIQISIGPTNFTVTGPTNATLTSVSQQTPKYNANTVSVADTAIRTSSRVRMTSVGLVTNEPFNAFAACEGTLTKKPKMG